MQSNTYLNSQSSSFPLHEVQLWWPFPQSCSSWWSQSSHHPSHQCHHIQRTISSHHCFCIIVYDNVGMPVHILALERRGLDCGLLWVFVVSSGGWCFFWEGGRRHLNPHPLTVCWPVLPHLGALGSRHREMAPVSSPAPCFRCVSPPLLLSVK